MYKDYFQLLDKRYSPDLWSDEGINVAVEILDGFSASDWNVLTREIKTKDGIWQAKCAETLSESNPRYAIPILKSMLSSDNKDVVEAAVDSLNSFSQDGFDIELDEHEKLIVTDLSKGSGLLASIAERLLRSRQV